MSPVEENHPPIWRILKFGGSSVSDPDSWKAIQTLVARTREQKRFPFVVVSALSGITDLLADHISPTSSTNADELIGIIKERHQTLCKALDLDATLLDHHWQKLNDHLADRAALDTPQGSAKLLAMGEIWSATIGQAYLTNHEIPVDLIDSIELLYATPQPARSERAQYMAASCEAQPNSALAAKLAEQADGYIMPGFSARNTQGETVLLGRGGSDTSAALMGALLDAERVEIYSDVPGLFSADPHRIPTARLLKVVSYREAQELAAMGAKAIHPHALAPLRAHNIPLWLGQTLRPDIEGTQISSKARDHGAQVKAIVQRRHIALISLEDIGMWQQVGFLAEVFQEFKDMGLSVDQVSTSESNVTLTLDLRANVADEADIERLIDRLKKHCHVEWVPDCACVSLVGLGIRTILHRLGPALEVFEQRRIYQVSQAANDLNLTFVVEARHADRLVQQLHQQLIPGGLGGDSVFGPTWEQLFKQQDAPKQEPPWWRTHKEALRDLMAPLDCAYVYHLPTIEAAADRLLNLEFVDRVLYSMKANPHPEILGTLYGRGVGIECVSLQEVEHATSHLPDLKPHEILFTPNFADRSEYQKALALGVRVTVDNTFILERWGQDFAGHSIFLRLDPGSGLGHHKMVRTAGSHAKFGVPLAEIEKIARLATAHDIRIVGLHAHTGSGILHPDNWHRTLEILGEAAETLASVETIDLGGGLGIPDHDDALPLDLAALDAGIGRLKAQLPRPMDIWLEPGRYLVANAGALLARVTQTKGKGDVRYVGVATGMNSLIRPALYGAWHPIYHFDRLGERGDNVYNVVGPICETGDILGLDRLLPECQPGDLLLIANTGAYGRVMASHYNLRDPAPEHVLRS
ncbi:MAG TPA: bifunctional aspartate kinase/diaminopimelate decarboxylase [Wenzhouxiangella sp.]